MGDRRNSERYLVRPPIIWKDRWSLRIGFPLPWQRKGLYQTRDTQARYIHSQTIWILNVAHLIQLTILPWNRKWFNSLALNFKSGVYIPKELSRCHEVCINVYFIIENRTTRQDSDTLFFQFQFLCSLSCIHSCIMYSIPQGDFAKAYILKKTKAVSECC